MTNQQVTALSMGGVGLLERSINYTLGSLLLIRRVSLARPTPCAQWDLRALLAHMNDSLLALHEALDVGHVPLEPAASDERDPVAGLRTRACRLLGAAAQASDGGVISVADRSLTAGIVTGTGAVEIAAHGWDVAESCGEHRPIPPRLAAELLELAPLFVSDADRPGRFAQAIEPPHGAGNGERLLCFLGRQL